MFAANEHSAYSRCQPLPLLAPSLPRSLPSNAHFPGAWCGCGIRTMAVGQAARSVKSTAPHCAAQRSAAQHSTAQHPRFHLPRWRPPMRRRCSGPCACAGQQGRAGPVNAGRGVSCGGRVRRAWLNAGGAPWIPARPLRLCARAKHDVRVGASLPPGAWVG
ncbi:hypothetical protein BS50DRAFT_341167 [Corynespora cassiicola Philippines]|uniref:Uncharacterized protein n=1 Tax=Corynespora cassiicola Philippines TaxID=1448308 RepID=A0A2T2NVJ8_CORCC|nr:hypothetical protein BS50DRAFT_341167 [Corynespora cassiicola Philippines]